MRRTYAQTLHLCNELNIQLFERDNRYYTRVNRRNGYYALDLYRRCPDCQSMADARDINVVCNYDNMVDVLGTYEIGELYEALKLANTMLRF